jgi:very-short-patch-repair endonuclease
MRLRPAPAEQKLWFCLRDRRLNGLKFRRQTVIGPYIADFCCAEHRLIIEVDGDSHADRERYDQRRTTWMDKGGYRVLRFTNQEVAGSLDGVLLGIVRQCGLEAGETSRSAE